MKIYQKRTLWVVGLLSSLLIILLLPSVAFADPPSPLDPASAKAEGNSFMYWLDFWIATLIFLGVQGALIYAIIRFKEKDPGFIPRQIHGNTRLEVIWTVAPALILIFIFSVAWPIMRTRDAPPETTMQINVTGHQWWWEFEYPEAGVVLGNEVHIPVGESVRVELTSENVLHSFWIPQLSGKTDVVPGRTNVAWFQADEPGIYRGICAELCGAQHANMSFTVVAEPREDFEAWLTAQQAPPVEPGDDELRARGQEVFLANACIGCHKIEGTMAQGITGPNLTHFANRRTIAGLVQLENTPENLRQWISDPQGLKPLNQMPNLYLPQEDLDALVAYLSSLQ